MDDRQGAVGLFDRRHLEGDPIPVRPEVDDDVSEGACLGRIQGEGAVLDNVGCALIRDPVPRCRATEPKIQSTRLIVSDITADVQRFGPVRDTMAQAASRSLICGARSGERE